MGLELAMKISLFCMCVFGMILVSGCVTADQYQLLENRIATVEMERSNKNSQGQKDLKSVQLKLDDLTKVTREHYAESKYEIQQIKVEFQKVDGLIEEIKHNFGTTRQAYQDELEKRLERLDNAISRNYEKVINIEKYMGFEPTDTKSTDPNSKPLTKSELGSEQESYNLAKKMFDDGDKENARIQFENFINKYPDSKNADNARFWIADSYYVEKWYEKAILEYQKVLEKYPDSNKTAAARLKQGYSFAALGETANARLILKELIKQYPDSDEAKYAGNKLKSLN
ncbi:MAG: tol-pal system protein YbgF [Desulfobacteraceae bacterium]|nr:tol-pal system protein YbgF [Desulfobacteraceae bacterium]